jgi:hypothetical protein
MKPVAEDDVIRAAVLRLSRSHPSGGRVIERAAMAAAGADAARIMAWVVDHGEAEELAPATTGQGIHGVRASSGAGGDLRKPLRYVIPAAKLSDPAVTPAL